MSFFLADKFQIVDGRWGILEQEEHSEVSI